MKILLEIIGIALVLMGLVFTAQSESYIGPQSSFMYSNPSWTINGLMIIMAGVIILVVDIIIRIDCRQKPRNR
jgi:hypothetical protein